MSFACTIFAAHTYCIGYLLCPNSKYFARILFYDHVLGLFPQYPALVPLTLHAAADLF